MARYSTVYVYDCSYESRVEHYRVIHGKQSFLTIDGEIYFENMAKLVEVCFMQIIRARY